MAFNVQAAKKAGYTDAEIQQYLGGQSNNNIYNQAAQLGGAMLGGNYGGRAGVALGAMIPGANLTGASEMAGGYLGASTGAGIGAGVGNAAVDLVRRGLGDQSVNLDQTIPNSIQAGKEAATGQAIGGPIAKVLGVALHPMQTATKGLIGTLSKSNAKIDVGNVIDAITNKVAPQAEQSGLGVAGRNEINKTTAPLISAVKSLQKSPILMNALGIPPRFNQVVSDPNLVKALPSTLVDTAPNGLGDVAGYQLPIKQAYGLKSNYQDMVANAGGYGGNPITPTVQGQKAIASGLRQEIHNASPVDLAKGQIGVQGWDKLLQSGYQAQDILNVLSKIPHVGQGIGALLGLPGKTAQSLVSQNGGRAGKALPSLIQMILMGNQASGDAANQ